MFKQLQILFLLLCALSLTACLKVEDKSNKKVADAITEQNKILAQQAAQTKTSISVTGIINNLSTGDKATSATVTIKVGVTEFATVTVNNGAFQVDNLPADSDFELVVHSTTSAFMNRTVFGRTRATNSLGIIYQDLGIISVAVGIERTFTILNSATNVPITNLILLANSSVGTGANYEQYLHTSSYDTATQQYKITLPEQLSIGIYAKLDVNNDGKVDYNPEDNSYGFGDYLEINSAQIINANPIYLFDLNVHIQIKISLLDAALNPLLGATPSIVDTLNGTLNATYNSVTSQYVFDALIDENLIVMVPAFVVNGSAYSGSSIQVSRIENLGSTRYSLVTSHTFSSTFFNFTNDAPHIFDVVLQPTVLTAFSNLAVASKSSAIDVVAEGFKVFYTGPVTVDPSAVQLIKKNAMTVTKGNASATDIILAGTTYVQTMDEPVAVGSQLSLNDTLLTVTPNTALAEGYSYSYTVGSIIDNFLNVSANPFNDFLDFEVKSTATFAITDVKLDNNNYYTNGNLINATNTANEPSPSYYFSQSVSLYLPTSIENLKTLTLRKEKTIKDNIESNSIQNINVVANGVVNYYNKVITLSLASNEYVVGNNSTWSLLKGTALVDSNWYTFSIDEYMSDNITANTNSVSFAYAFETKDGVQETGTITLPVL